MPDNERKEELRNNIERWQKELEEVWRDTDTDAAEVERRNLRDLINNARSELDELEGNRSIGENDNEITPEELIKKLEEEEKDISKSADRKRIELKIERLKEEREDYKDDKKLYEEYTKSIEEEEKRLEELEKEEIDYEEMDKNLKILTKGRMQEENKRAEIEKAIRRKQQEIQEIEYGTEEALEDIELSDGTKVKNPKVLRLYEELNELQSQLRYTNRKIEEYQKMINKVKGVEKEESHELNPEEVRYFHGQGDMNEIYGANGEDTKNNRHANDEYFGLGKKPEKKPIRPEKDPPQKPEPPEEDPPQKPEPPEEDPPQKPDPTLPNGNLPLRSGLQVYRDLLNETGYIRGTKAIAAHDWLNKFGLIGKVPAFIIRKATGRKQEIARIEEILDDIQENNPKDFELLMDDFLLKDGDYTNVMNYKVNEILLMAVEKKLQKDFNEIEPILSEKEQEYRNEYDELGAELETTKDENTQIEIMSKMESLGVAIKGIHDRRQLMERRIRGIKDGRDNKSLEKKNNIKGKTRANRNPDNREEINELADIELDKLEAEARGNKFMAVQYEQEMDDYADSQTEYIYSRKGKVKVSKGAFDKKEGDIRVVSHQKYIAPEMLHAAALATTVAALQFNNFLNQVNRLNPEIQKVADLKNTLSGKHVQAGMDSLNVDATNIQGAGERASDFAGAFDPTTSAYKAQDAIGVTRADKVINNLNGFATSPKGSPALKLAEIFDKKSQIASTYGQEAYNELAKNAAQYYSGGHLMSSGGVDHTLTSVIEQAVGKDYSSQAGLFSAVADVLKKLDSIDVAALQKMDLDLTPILATLIPTASKMAQENIKNSQEKTVEQNKNEQDVEEYDEYEEYDDEYNKENNEDER